MSSAPATVEQLCAAIDEVWPSLLAEDWDRVGLVLGSPAQVITRVLFLVDVTADTVREAIDGGYDAIIAHHPLLLRGVTSLAENRAKGALVSQLIRANIALISAHTNADAVDGGVADVFAERLRLSETEPIERNSVEHSAGIGRVGLLAEATTIRELAQRIAALLPATVTGVRVAGDPDAIVHRVALCPGAGDSLLEHPLVRSADVYITADLRHHPASEAKDSASTGNRAPVLIDVSHWASESLWLQAAADQLAELVPDVQFDVSSHCTDAWQFSVGSHAELPTKER